MACFCSAKGASRRPNRLLRSVLDMRLSLYGTGQLQWLATARVSLAMLLHDKGDFPGAESEFRQALAIYDKSLPANHQYRASALMHFARLLVDRGKIDEALAKSDESIKIWTATLPASSPPLAQAHAIHAYALEHSGKSPRSRRGTRGRSPDFAESAGS